MLNALKMKVISNIKLNWINITGAIVLLSFLFMSITAIINNFFPTKLTEPLSTENFIKLNSSRYMYEDSLDLSRKKELEDTFFSIVERIRVKDSFKYNFYTIKQIQYEKDINTSNNTPASIIVQQWERDYANR